LNILRRLWTRPMASARIGRPGASSTHSYFISRVWYNIKI
jgi:hypothetical protein